MSKGLGVEIRVNTFGEDICKVGWILVWCYPFAGIHAYWETGFICMVG